MTLRSVRLSALCSLPWPVHATTTKKQGTAEPRQRDWTNYRHVTDHCFFQPPPHCFFAFVSSMSISTPSNKVHESVDKWSVWCPVSWLLELVCYPQ